MAALIREPPREGGPARGSACAPRPTSSTSPRSPAPSGGGGHRQAAGFSSDQSIEEITEFIRDRVRRVPCRRARLDPRARARRQAGGALVVRGRRASCARRTGARDRPRGHARPVRDRASARAPRRLDPPGAVPRRAGQALRDGGRPARADLDRRPRGRGASRSWSRRCGGARAGARRPRGEVELPIPAASAVKIDGERAYKLHRRGVAVEMPLRRSTVSARRSSGMRRRRDARPAGRLGHLRASIADALGGHCRTLRRTEVGPFRVEDADRERILPPVEALRSCRSRGDAAEAQAIRTAAARTSRCESFATASSWPSTGP